MKEQLSNSFKLLSDAIDELDHSISVYKNRNVEEMQRKLSDFHRMEEKSRTEIDNLKHALVVEQNKVNHALSEVRDLTISLKNKVNQF